jgi:peptidoglycan/xylan/chitin deacetylase (PgdA/CDA1 family)
MRSSLGRQTIGGHTRARWAGWGALGILTLSTAAFLAGPPHWLLDWLAARYPGCLYRVATRQPVLALTLDDGPDAVTTPLILAELQRTGARATFFLIAERVQGQERLVQQLVGAGHEIGNHFTRNAPSVRLSASAFARDLAQAHRVLSAHGPVYWARPGSGWYSQTMIATMARQSYRCALGSVYPYDAAIPSVTWARRHILRNAAPGSIIILHDGGARGGRTVQVLRAVLPELLRRGFRVVTLSELAAAA